MDGLEQKAIDGMPVTKPTAPATQDPGQQAPSTGNLQDTQEFKDALQEATKGFQGDYTQKTQAIADERRSLQAERANLDQERQQVLAAIDRPQDANQGPLPYSQQLPDEDRDNLDPNATRVLNRLGELNEAAIAPLRETISTLQNTVKQQDVQLKQVQGQNWQRQKQQEVQEVQAKYGPELIKENEQAISNELKKNPGLTVENALMISAPDAYRAHIQAEEAAKAQEAIQTQYGAALEGIAGSPGAEPTPAFEEGESMETSLKREMGPVAYRQTIIEDALKEQ